MANVPSSNNAAFAKLLAGQQRGGTFYTILYSIITLQYMYFFRLSQLSINIFYMSKRDSYYHSIISRRYLINKLNRGR